MNAAQIEAVEDELEKLGLIVKAAENWSKAYTKDKKTHAKLIKNEVKMERALRGFFREQAAVVSSYINWAAYTKFASEVKVESSVKAALDFDIKTVISDNFFDSLDSEFVNVIFDYLSTGTALGAQAGENIYKIPLGITSTSDIIQKLTTERVAFLVGKRVDKEGNIVDNPNKAYRISDKTREQVAKAIKESIDLGEDRNAATLRLTSIIKDPGRAEVIAQTESVNAYGSGLHEFGKESGAVGKEAQDVQATDYCKDYADEGVVPLDHLWGGEHLHPAFHTGCRCGERLVYANEKK